MRVLSWNVKSFASAVNMGGNARDIIERVVGAFDIAVLYEVPNSPGGTNACATLDNALPNHNHFLETTRGLGNEDDQIAVFWDTTTANLVNTTAARRPSGFGGRQPIYFNVTDVANNNVQEMCAWHAPEPQGMAEAIAQDWVRIKTNSEDHDGTALTGLVMGDFNAELTVGRRGRGRGLVQQIAPGGRNGTTLIPGQQGVRTQNVQDYRTSNTYDQFYADPNLVQPVRAGLYDIMDRLATNQAPFAGLYGSQYNTPSKAYTFYFSALSDHLPVAIDVNIL